MKRYGLSPSARRDLLDIIDFIAADNADAARGMRDRFFAAFRLLSEQPGLGHVRDDLIARSTGVRFWPVGTYQVIYRNHAGRVEIARVLSGYRDTAAILDLPEAT